MHYIALVLSITFNGVSLVLLKSFAVDREHGALGTTYSGFRMVLSPRILAAMLCFAAAAVTWMIALAGVDLSLAYPSMSVIYVATALAGRHLFREAISAKRWTGIGLVVAGIILMYAG